MKPFIVICLLLVRLTAISQTIRIADNNINRPGGANVFATLQLAVNAAVDGDIVYIQPSVTTYGDATIGKRITLKGVGFGVTELGGRASTVGTLTIVNSSNGVSSVSNSVFKDFSFSTITFNAGTGSSTFNNLIFENLSGNTINTSNNQPNMNDLVIRNCYVITITLNGNFTHFRTKLYNNIFDRGTISFANAPDPLVTNNIFFTSSNNFYMNFDPSVTGARIEHNIFSGTGNVFYNLRNQQVVNNIFYGTTPGSVGPTFLDNVFSHNLFLTNVSTIPPAATGGGSNSGIGNIVGVAPQFVDAPSAATAWSAVTSLYNYNLGPSSPCLNAASTGDNIGPSSGTYPLNQNVKFTAAAIPIITEFNNTGTVNLNQPLRANVKAKSN
ncbi:hypothetical protein BH09BAC3_BH09BAC3_30720 [soil metagenome]